jgi:hypothetical protein
MIRPISKLSRVLRYLIDWFRFDLRRMAFENPAYWILHKSRNYQIITLDKKQMHLEDYYTLYEYNSNSEYQDKQKSKTRKRLLHMKKSKESVLWTQKEDIFQLAALIKERYSKKYIHGMCMGSRSGEEQQLFREFLGLNSKVIGVEIEDSAKDLPNTLIADFHELPLDLTGTQDFVYSNSHDQSNDPQRALKEWIRILQPGGILILEHSRSHGKLHQGWQDPFGIESELLPFVMMNWFPIDLHLESVLNPKKKCDPYHYFFIFRKV